MSNSESTIKWQDLLDLNSELHDLGQRGSPQTVVTALGALGVDVKDVVTGYTASVVLRVQELVVQALLDPTLDLFTELVKMQGGAFMMGLDMGIRLGIRRAPSLSFDTATEE